MPALRAVAGGQLELGVRQAGDGEVADDLARLRQHRRQRQPPRLGDIPCHDPVQPGPRLRPADPIFAKVLHLVDADAGPHRPHLLRRRLPGVGTLEGRGLMARLARQGVVVHHFQPVLLAPDGVHLVEHLIHRRGAERPRGGAFLVGVADVEPHLVVLDHLRHGIAGAGPVAEPRHVKAARVALDLAVDHPLRQRQTPCRRPERTRP